jgi:hypothetical protein
MRILHLSQNRIGGTRRKSYVAEDISAHSGSFQVVLENGKPLFVFSQNSYCYTLHGITLANISMLLKYKDYAK